MQSGISAWTIGSACMDAVIVTEKKHRGDYRSALGEADLRKDGSGRARCFAEERIPAALY
jgi:hypothetical protein